MFSYDQLVELDTRFIFSEACWTSALFFYLKFHQFQSLSCDISHTMVIYLGPRFHQAAQSSEDSFCRLYHKSKSCDIVYAFIILYLATHHVDRSRVTSLHSSSRSCFIPTANRYQSVLGILSRAYLEQSVLLLIVLQIYQLKQIALFAVCFGILVLEI